MIGIFDNLTLPRTATGADPDDRVQLSINGTDSGQEYIAQTYTPGTPEWSNDLGLQPPTFQFSEDTLDYLQTLPQPASLKITLLLYLVYESVTLTLDIISHGTFSEYSLVFIPSANKPFFLPPGLIVPTSTKRYQWPKRRREPIGS